MKITKHDYQTKIIQQKIPETCIPLGLYEDGSFAVWDFDNFPILPAEFVDFSARRVYINSLIRLFSALKSNSGLRLVVISHQAKGVTEIGNVMIVSQDYVFEYLRYIEHGNRGNVIHVIDSPVDLDVIPSIVRPALIFDTSSDDRNNVCIVSKDTFGTFLHPKQFTYAEHLVNPLGTFWYFDRKNWKIVYIV